MTTPFTRLFFFLTLIALNTCLLFGQEVPIVNYSTNSNGQVQLEVNSTTSDYYILKIKHKDSTDFDLATSMTLGKSGSTIISEALGSYPLAQYQVLRHTIASPADTDQDGVDDMAEYQQAPEKNPLNAAPSIQINDGAILIDDFSTFKFLSITKQEIQWSEFLNGKVFVKYIITDFNTSSPKIYFVNSNVHDLHADFASAIGIDYLGDQVKKGQVIYHPTSISNNGTPGAFAFNYSNGHGQEFEVVRRTHELLAANMPFLTNNLSYFITANNEVQYSQDSLLYQQSRVPILLESDVYADIDYWGLNPAEGFGFFRQMELDEVPGPKDIVLYESLPNALPRVGGIMTSVIQTPLSHVNLRAIQNKIPNAFIRDPLSVDSIADLLNRYIYFKVEQDKYFIREATLEEVNEWFEDIRPTEEQQPPLNLKYTEILPLERIAFPMYDGFGAKCANIATMRTFGFPEGTIPDGFGVPFYFYQEFMEYNHFFDEVGLMLNDSAFNSDRVLRDDMLKAFRTKIKEAEMPAWMLDELAAMHESFPVGTSVRCRSSTNNEDLPGFNGAGLYTSKTQHPSEGHISKSIKQVYASLWNLRAFEERDFYRVNHYATSMGVLCHPNYTDEKANGVGVSIDPIYNTKNTFYLNSQLGEELITNPDTASLAEEILLDRVSVSDNDYIVIQRSNLVPNDSIIMGEQYLDQMREYLTVIHDQFALLYEAVDNKYFAMDIEYKITSDDQLIIKQARPWVSYILQEEEVIIDPGDGDLLVYPNPVDNLLTIVLRSREQELTQVTVVDIMGRILMSQDYQTQEGLNKWQLDVAALAPANYILLVQNKNSNEVIRLVVRH